MNSILTQALARTRANSKKKEESDFLSMYQVTAAINSLI